MRSVDAQWRHYLLGALILLLVILSSLIVLDVPIEVNALSGYTRNINVSPTENQDIEELYAKNGVEHYAYMDLDSATPELRSIIVEARKRIIESRSWVADEAEGWITDRDGNIIEVLPKFHELFPEGWEDVLSVP